MNVLIVEDEPGVSRFLRRACSATEYSLLEYLMRHAGKTMPRSAILDHVW